jgi:hypothetical protein
MTAFCKERGKMEWLLAAALLAFAACQSPTTQTGPGASTPAAQPESRLSARVSGGVSSGPTRDLSQDEAAGGHILRKHVGRTDDELRERLDREREISGSSTYTDRATAERAVGAAIAESHGRIEHWLDRAGRHTNLVIDYESPEPIGRTMNRGENRAHACSHALVVLKYAGPNDYYVLTSYPECR